MVQPRVSYASSNRIVTSGKKMRSGSAKKSHSGSKKNSPGEKS